MSTAGHATAAVAGLGIDAGKTVPLASRYEHADAIDDSYLDDSFYNAFQYSEYNEYTI